MSVGQVLELDIVGEKHLRLLQDDQPAEASSTEQQAQAPTVGSVGTENAPATEGTSTEPAPATNTSEQKPNDKESTTTAAPKISAGVNFGHEPAQSHSEPKKVGTKGDRYIFTESPVEYYYYHQPVVQKIQPT